MPPLQASFRHSNCNQQRHHHSYCGSSPPSDDEGASSYRYVTVEDNRIYRGKINRDIFSQAPVPSGFRQRGNGFGPGKILRRLNGHKLDGDDDGEFVVLSQRDVVVGPSPLYAASVTTATMTTAMPNSRNGSNNENDGSVRRSTGGVRTTGGPSGGKSSPGLTNLMDMITTLCVGPEAAGPAAAGCAPLAAPAAAGYNRNSEFGERAGGARYQQQRGQPPSLFFGDVEVGQRNIVYPVARYPARLNSPEMVRQRRKSLEKHLMFRPVCRAAATATEAVI